MTSITGRKWNKLESVCAEHWRTSCSRHVTIEEWGRHPVIERLRPDLTPPNTRRTWDLNKKLPRRRQRRRLHFILILTDETPLKHSITHIHTSYAHEHAKIFWILTPTSLRFNQVFRRICLSLNCDGFKPKLRATGSFYSRSCLLNLFSFKSGGRGLWMYWKLLNKWRGFLCIMT